MLYEDLSKTKLAISYTFALISRFIMVESKTKFNVIKDIR